MAAENPIRRSEVGASVEVNKRGTYEKITDKLTKIPIPSLENFLLTPKNPANKNYGVRIVTGSMDGAGETGQSIYMILSGTLGTSKNIELTSWCLFCKNEFGKQTYDDLIVVSEEDLGEILVVTIGNKSHWIWQIKDPWYVEYVEVINFQMESKKTNFPCYHWIGDYDYYELTSATSICSAIKDSQVLLNHRKKQITERKDLYTWKINTDNGTPSSIDTAKDKLPADEQFDRVKQNNFTGNLFKAGVGLGIGALKLAVNHFFDEHFKVMEMQSLHDYYRLASVIKYQQEINTPTYQPAPEYYDKDLLIYQGYRWVSDVEFGRQILNGVNPVIVRKCTELPSNFPVTNEMVREVLDKSLQEEMQRSRIYICDLSQIMHGLPCREGYYSAAPLCLLYVNNSRKLVPIAIQLEKDPGTVDNPNPIFLSTDSWFDWLLAKIYYNSAHLQLHQISTHYVSCHAAMEAYSMATMRTLPDAHPVYKLIRTYCRYTMAINSAARANLINDGGIIDSIFAIGGDTKDSGKNKLFCRSNEIYDIQLTNIRKNVKDRGCDNPDELPDYYYRDDGFKVWDTIHAFVTDIINLHYKSDKDVKEDSELKNWANEINTHAFPAFGSNKSGRGFPNEITTKNLLCELCTLIMFTGSAQHSAVNFGQFQVYGYVPNASVGIENPPPKKKGICNYRFLIESMPNLKTAGLAIATAWSLSQYSPDEIYLGGFPTNWFSEESANAAVKKFISNIEVNNKKIEERNKGMDLDYPYLHSTRIPNSITI